MESRYAITPHPAAAHQQYLKHTASSQRTSSPTSSPPHNGLSTSSTVEVQQVPPRPLSAIAQQAYDRYGVIDHARLDLMVRGIFITREDAARLPHRITPDGCPDVRTGVSHHQRASMGGISTAPAPRPAGGGGDNPEGASAAATAAAVRAAAAKPRAPSSARASPSARATGVSAVPSSHEKWTEGEVRLLIGLRAENVGFRFIADRFPGKNQKAVQEKFYKSVKDTRDPRWRQLYKNLCGQHDGAVPGAVPGTAEDPIEIADEEAAVVQAAENSSETLSETTIGDRNAEGIEVSEDAVKDKQATV